MWVSSGGLYCVGRCEFNNTLEFDPMREEKNIQKQRQSGLLAMVKGKKDGGRRAACGVVLPTLLCHSGQAHSFDPKMSLAWGR